MSIASSKTKMAVWRRWVKDRVNSITIDSSGNTTFAGNVAFPATQVPSSDPNTLDDYEEVNWTPILSDGTNNATSSIAIAKAQKIGDRIYFRGRLATSSLGSVSGNIRILGLPYVSSNVANSFGSVYIGHASTINITAGESVAGYVTVNGSHILLRTWDTGNGQTNMQASEWTAVGAVMFAGFYEV